jgi:hypothetical protein
MDVSVLRSIEELIARRDAWAELADNCGARPAGHPWWGFSALQEVGWRPTAVAIEEGGQLVGLGLFQVIRPMGVQLLRFLGPRWAPNAPLVARDRLDVETLIWDVLHDQVGATLDLASFDASRANVRLAASAGSSAVQLVGWRGTQPVEQLLQLPETSPVPEVIASPERVSDVVGRLAELAGVWSDERNALAGPRSVFTRTLLHLAAVEGRLRVLLSETHAEVWLLTAGSMQRVARWGRPERYSQANAALVAAAQVAREAGASTLDLADAPLPPHPSEAAPGRYATFNLRMARSVRRRATASGVMGLRDALVREGR